MHSLFIIFKGTLDLIKDNVSIQLSSASITNVFPYSEVEITSISTDLDAVQIIFTDEYITGLFTSEPPFPAKYIFVDHPPVIEIPNDKIEVFKNYTTRMIQLFIDKNHHFQINAIKCLMWLIFLDFGELIFCKYESLQKEKINNKKKNILLRYFTLLKTNFYKEHSVTFYADKLNISVQYLERVVKELTGISVKQSICHILLQEINRNLMNPSLTIKSISFMFSFPDQLTFSKFYKKYMKMTPSEYRSKYLL